MDDKDVGRRFEIYEMEKCIDIGFDIAYKFQTSNFTNCIAETLVDNGYKKLKDGWVVIKKGEKVDLFEAKPSGFMTSAIGDIPLNIDGMRMLVDEVSRLLRVQSELQELNANYYNSAKSLMRELKQLQQNTTMENP